MCMLLRLGLVSVSFVSVSPCPSPVSDLLCLLDPDAAQGMRVNLPYVFDHAVFFWSSLTRKGICT